MTVVRLFVRVGSLVPLKMPRALFTRLTDDYVEFGYLETLVAVRTSTVFIQLARPGLVARRVQIR